jgi:hypothetical protein
MVLPTRSAPVTLGTPVFVTGTTGGADEGGGVAGGGATTCDAELRADAEPPAFDAVTLTRSVEPTSVLLSSYWESLAPPMSEQLPPPLSQRFHWYAYDVGLFDHEPVDDDSAWSCCAVPPITGTAVFTGAATTEVGAAGAAATKPEAELVTVPEPPAFEAVTTTRNVLPTSVDVNVSDDPVAPVTSAHEPPPVSQRRHW